MNPLSVTFDIPASILQGLADGSLIRNGGVIQDTSGQIVMWLKELSGTGIIADSLLLPSINPATGILNLAMQGVNAGISMRGFAAVTKELHAVQNILTLTSAASILNLGVSAIGFSIIIKKLYSLEKRLKEAEKSLKEIDYKVDLSFYSNFRAALDLANNAFLMVKGENRKVSTHSAINRFLEAEHIYTELVDQELENKSQIGDEYLLTLCLAYISEARCYLELEEPETAIRRFEEGKKIVRARIEKYIDILLTPNPSMYLSSPLIGHTDLSRITHIFQWKDPTLNENSVFEAFRKSDFNFDISDSSLSAWMEYLPAPIIESKEIKKGFWGIKDESKEKIIRRLPSIVEEMESMVETSRRFDSYELEVKAIDKLGMSFSEWLNFANYDPKYAESNVLFIIPKEPIKIDF